MTRAVIRQRASSPSNRAATARARLPSRTTADTSTPPGPHGEVRSERTTGEQQHADQHGQGEIEHGVHRRPFVRMRASATVARIPSTEAISAASTPSDSVLASLE